MTSGRDPELRDETVEILMDLAKAAAKAAAHVGDHRMRVLDGAFIRSYLQTELPNTMDDVTTVARQMATFNDVRHEQSYSKQRSASRAVAEARS